MPHLTNLPPNPPEEFSMLKEIFDQQVFELCIHEENGQKAYYIPYMMNDALECYLIHWYFFDAILTFTEVNRYSIIYRVLGGVGVFVVSGILIRLLKKLSWGRMLVP